MPSAEATLQFQTSVGIASPTMLQTLLDLLNLYISDDTDRRRWISAFESHPATLMTVVAADDGPIEAWHENSELNALRSFSLALVNQIALGHPSVSIYSNEAIVQMSAQLTQALAPELARTAALVCRLSGQDYRGADSAVKEALDNQQRPLNELQDASLLTRLTATAWHCVRSETIDVRACMDLFSQEGADEAIFSFSSDVDSPVSVETLQESVGHSLALANLKHTINGLASLTSREAALRELASAFFDTSALHLFLQDNNQHGNGWSNGNHRVQSGHSIIVAAAESGRVLPSSAHPLTLLDERALSELDCADALALPVLMDDHPDSCAAVVLIGMSKSRLLETAGRQDLTKDFQILARGLISTSDAPRISLDELDARAREIIHEASNPLSTIQNYLKVLSLKLGAEHEAQETLDTIASELQRTADIIRQFRDIGEGHQPGDARSRVNRIVREIAGLFDRTYETVIFDYQMDNTDPEALISADRLKQIMTNLIKNAVEAGCDEIQVSTIGQFTMGSQYLVEITVRDSGPGIASEVDDIFERGATTKQGDHAGEGLAVVKELTESAGGFVSYRSDHRGTEFRVAIPQTRN